MAAPAFRLVSEFFGVLRLHGVHRQCASGPTVPPTSGTAVAVLLRVPRRLFGWGGRVYATRVADSRRGGRKCSGSVSHRRWWSGTSFSTLSNARRERSSLARRATGLVPRGSAGHKRGVRPLVIARQGEVGRFVWPHHKEGLWPFVYARWGMRACELLLTFARNPSVGEPSRAVVRTNGVFLFGVSDMGRSGSCMKQNIPPAYRLHPTYPALARSLSSEHVATAMAIEMIT